MAREAALTCFQHGRTIARRGCKNIAIPTLVVPRADGLDHPLAARCSGCPGEASEVRDR